MSLPPPRSLRAILSELGIAARRARLQKRAGNTHWLVYARSPHERVVLREFHRQFGERSSPASMQWEMCLMERLATRGWPVPRLLRPLLELDHRWYGVFSVVSGRPLPSGDASYRWMGRELARLQQDLQWATCVKPALCGQRPGWGSYVAASLPRTGGESHRQHLLRRLGQLDAGLAVHLQQRVSEFARQVDDLGLAELPRYPIHGDFSPWNLRRRRGQISALYDFDLSHLDVRLADLAFARRGYHDAVVDGYRELLPLSTRDEQALPVLWMGVLLYGAWETLALAEQQGRFAANDTTLLDDLRWTREQLAKVQPYVARRNA